LAGGSWARGRKVFFGEQAGCFKCHATNHQGGTIGPNLSNLIHRDYASVLRDVTKPNFAINPDYVGSTIRTVDGQTLDGVVRVRGNELHVGVKEGKTIVVDRENVDEMRPSSISIMPEGILKNVSPEQTRDLLTFLLSPAPSMPRDYTGGPPPKPRAAAEVHRLLVGAPRPPEKIRPVKIVLAAGAKDHGPGEHDYPAWQTAWKELLSAADQVEIETAWDWPSAEQFQTADAIVFFQHGDWNARRATDVDRFIERGGGLVYIHWAVDGRAAGGEFAKRIGLAGRGAVGYRHGDLTLSFNDEAAHPVLRNFGPLALTDETYWNMSGDLPKNRILASAVEEGKPRPQVWSLEPGKGRVFVSIPGHYSWTFDDPLFRVLLLRGIAWSAHEPVDRFNDLVWPGANVER
jgi:putative heme-binding domain-containing protein